MKCARQNCGAAFKFQIVLAGVKGDKILAELAEQFCLHLTQIAK